jgi:hypothetical protein
MPSAARIAYVVVKDARCNCSEVVGNFAGVLANCSAITEAELAGVLSADQRVSQISLNRRNTGLPGGSDIRGVFCKRQPYLALAVTEQADMSVPVVP